MSGSQATAGLVALSRVTFRASVSCLAFAGQPEELVVGVAAGSAGLHPNDGFPIRVVPIDLPGPWAWFHDGLEIAAVRACRLERLSLLTGAVLQSVPCEAPVRCLSVAPDGRRVAMAFDERMDLVDWAGQHSRGSEGLWEGGPARLAALAWSDFGGENAIWALGRATIEECIETIGFTTEVHTTVDEPHLRRLVYDFTGTEIWSVRFTEGDLAFEEPVLVRPAPDGEHVAFLDRTRLVLATAIDWSYSHQRPIISKSHNEYRSWPLSGPATAFAWSRVGQEMALGFADGTVSLFDFKGRPLARCQAASGSVTGLAWSADDGTLAVASGVEVSLWGTAQQKAD